MDFPINAKAEGRILVPWEHKMYPNTSQQDSSGSLRFSLPCYFAYSFAQVGSRVCLGANLCPIGEATVMFGMHSVGHVIPPRKLVAYSGRYAVYRPKAPRGASGPSYTSPRLSQTRILPLSLVQTTHLTSARSHGRDTNRAIISVTGVPSRYCIPSSRPQRRRDSVISSSQVTTITRPQRNIPMVGIQRTW